MKRAGRILSLLLVLCVLFGMTAVPALASTFTDAHGNEIELDDSLEAYSEVTLLGADDAARRGETNLGDLWTDALRWFAVSGKINEYFEEDDVTAGNTALAVDADHVVALWNGGNLRADIPAGKFGAVELAEALPYPNKVAVVYMTGAQLKEALEAASQGLPYNEGSAAACASFMQAAGVKYTVDLSVPYAQGEAYGKNWFRAASLGRVTVTEVNGAALDEAATYAVITSNANFNGMDSSYIFKEAAEANEKSAITTAVVRDVVWMYIRDVLGGTVGDDYAAPAGRILLNGAEQTEPTAVFADVDATAYYYDAVLWAVEKGITAGTSATTFSPADTCTRAQMVTFLWRAIGSPEPAAAESPFADVTDPGAYYYKAVLWAVEKGITTGTTATAFDPNGTVSRAQAVTFLYRLAGEPETSAENGFADVGDGAYYRQAVLWAAEKGVTTGKTADAFAPADPCLRGQIVTFLYRDLK